jgi:glucose-6-phosphate dehydrogenase assembly protein OpcA
VEIEHDTGSRSQALLLAGWLVSRLGWRVGPRAGGPGGFFRDTQPIAATFLGITAALILVPFIVRHWGRLVRKPRV